MLGGLTRAIARLHFHETRKKKGPLGAGMAVFQGDHVSTKIQLDGAFALPELEAIERFVLPHISAGTVFFDIGANIGNHSRFFAPKFDQVFAFEPHPRTSLLLRANAYGTNIAALTYGLSSEAADLPAQSNLDNMGGSRVVAEGAQSDTTFRVERLDDVVDSLTKTPIGFMKIDVEDHELEVIQGAENTIKANKPVIAIEVNPTTVENGSNPAVEALKALGYTQFYDFENQASWTRIRAKFPQRLVRSLLRLFNPSAVYDVSMVAIQTISPKGHALVIASMKPLF